MAEKAAHYGGFVAHVQARLLEAGQVRAGFKGGDAAAGDDDGGAGGSAARAMPRPIPVLPPTTTTFLPVREREELGLL
jgi:hypothetical protein